MKEDRGAIKKPVKGTSVDLSHLFVIKNDIKFHFKNLEIRESRMKKGLAVNHNRYFSKIMQNPTQISDETNPIFDSKYQK